MVASATSEAFSGRVRHRNPVIQLAVESLFGHLSIRSIRAWFGALGSREFSVEFGENCTSGISLWWVFAFGNCNGVPILTHPGKIDNPHILSHLVDLWLLEKPTVFSRKCADWVGFVCHLVDLFWCDFLCFFAGFLLGFLLGLILQISGNFGCILIEFDRARKVFDKRLQQALLPRAPVAQRAARAPTQRTARSARARA